jgi:hypothetical protein
MLRAWLAAIVVTTLSCGAAHAQPTAKDSQVIVRALTFLESPPTGTADLAIVFAPASSDSVSQAQTLAGLFAGGITVGHLTLRPRLVPAVDLPALSNVAAIYVAGDLGPLIPALSAAGRRLHVPTLSTDMACVDRGACMIGVSTAATVRIVLNRAACLAAGIVFIQAFRILVTEE